MRIAELRISNFRGIREGRIRLGGHTVLVGPNNSGKTTVMEALALLFGRDRLVRALTEHDFHGSNPQPADRILIVATLTGFSPNDPTSHLDWFKPGRAVPKWLDESTGSIHPLQENESWLCCAQVAVCARFDRESLEVETIRYFYDDDNVADPFDDEVIATLGPKLVREIGLFLVPANRTWDRIMSFGSELFRRVVALAGGQPAETILQERDRLRAPESPIEADGNLASLVASVNGEMESLFGSSPTLHLRVTSTDSESVLNAVTPHYSFDGGLQLPARRQGTGLVSLQSLMLLLQFGQMRARDGRGFCLALEEPELHVPPALQRRLLHRIQALSNQTIACTHSPVVAASYDPTNILALTNRDGALQAEALLPDSLPGDAPNWMRKLYHLNREQVVDCSGAPLLAAIWPGKSARDSVS